MFWLARDLFLGLMFLGLLAATPWVVDQIAQQNRPDNLPETTIVTVHEPYFDLTLSRKDERFAAIGLHGQVSIGQIDDPTAEIDLDLPEHHVTCLQFSPRESALLLGCLDGAVLWQSIEPLDEPKSLKVFEESVSTVSTCQEGRYAAAASAPYDGKPAQIAVVDIKSGAELCHASAPKLIVWLAFTADSRELIYRDGNGSVGLIDIATGNVLQRWDLPALGTGPAALSSSGRWLAVGGDRGQVAIIDLQQRRIADQWPVSSMPISSLEFSRRGTVLACSTEEQLILINRRNHKVLAQQPTGVDRLHFSSTGKKLITSGHDGTIRRWALPNLLEEKRIVSAPL